KHVVWYPNDGGAFAYSIGLTYLFDLPEILLIDERTRPADGRLLARMINVLAAGSTSGLAPLRSDRAPATELQRDALAVESPQAAALFDQMAHGKWQVPSDDDVARHLGFASWF